MSVQVITPASLDDAAAELDGLGELLTATEWHRAAIVATFVRLDLGHGGRETVNTDHFASARRFADLGIRGLSSHVTVTHYVQAWLDEHEGTYPTPGVVVTLPTATWPPQKKNKGSRMTDNKLREAVREMPAADVVDTLDEYQREQVRAEIERRQLEPLAVPGGDVRDTTYFQLRAAIDNLAHAVNRVELAARPYGGDTPTELRDGLVHEVDRLGLVLDIVRGFDVDAWEAAQ